MSEPWTPGPWEWDDPNTLIAHDIAVILYVDDDLGLDEEVVPTEANARLIAAAPEMAALLRRVVAAEEPWEGGAVFAMDCEHGLSVSRPCRSCTADRAAALLARIRGESDV